MAWFECTGGSGGGGQSVLPSIITLQTSNRRAGQTLSYTFTEAGLYQYYAVIKFGNASGSASDFLIKLNDTVLTPAHTYSNSAYFMVYDNIVVSANDVLSYAPTNTYNDENGGLQLHVLKDADISVFDWLGNCDNSGATFDIVNDGVSLEVYYQGYYYWRNNCRSHLIANNTSPCTVYNHSQDFYFGGTYAIKVL